MKKMIMLAALLLLTTGCSALSNITNTCNFTADRSANVPVGDAKSILVRAEAGELRIEGKPGLTEVRVKGTACAASAAALEQVRLVAEQVEGEVRIIAEVPDNTSTFSVQGPQLDLVIEVPEQMALKIGDGSGDTMIRGVGAVTLEDGSGNVEIDGATGDVSVEDGSGDVTVRGVKGQVRITDGSGDINVTGTTGDVTITEDGSGSMTFADISGSVNVEVDGSGDITVDRVGGDFTLQDDGSGSVTVNKVDGKVTLP